MHSTEEKRLHVFVFIFVVSWSFSLSLSRSARFIARISSCSDDRLARFLSYTNIFMTEKRVICVQMIEIHWSLLLLLDDEDDGDDDDDHAADVIVVVVIMRFFLSFVLVSLVSCFKSNIGFAFKSFVSFLHMPIFLSPSLSYRMHSCQRVKSVVVFCSFASNTQHTNDDKEACIA